MIGSPWPVKTPNVPLRKLTAHDVRGPKGVNPGFAWSPLRSFGKAAKDGGNRAVRSMCIDGKWFSSGGGRLQPTAR